MLKRNKLNRKVRIRTIAIIATPSIVPISLAGPVTFTTSLLPVASDATAASFVPTPSKPYLSKKILDSEFINSICSELRRLT